VRKILVFAGLGTAAAAVAVVAGVATASTTASAPAQQQPASVALAAQGSSLDTVATQLAEKTVASDYSVTANIVLRVDSTDSPWYEVILVDSNKAHEFAVLVNVKTGQSGGIKEVPVGSIPLK
jgi:ABC-type phosphate transport system substrate-binding protein